MKTAIIAAAAILLCGEVYANDIDLSVDNFSRTGRIVSAILKLTNNVGQPITQVFVDCAFLGDDKKAIDIAKEIVSRIDANGYAYGKASIVTDHKVQYADCRVTSYKR